jgi:hypothetical protein
MNCSLAWRRWCSRAVVARGTTASSRPTRRRGTGWSRPRSLSPRRPFRRRGRRRGSQRRELALAQMSHTAQDAPRRAPGRGIGLALVIRQQAVANGDETGWYEGKSEGRKQRAWLWVVTTALVTIFRFARRRGCGRWRWTRPRRTHPPERLDSFDASKNGVLVSQRRHHHHDRRSTSPFVVLENVGANVADRALMFASNAAGRSSGRAIAEASAPP